MFSRIINAWLYDIYHKNNKRSSMCGSSILIKGTNKRTIVVLRLITAFVV